MGMIGIPENFALWVNREGHFGVMDTTKGEVWHPLDDGQHNIMVQRMGLDSKLRPVFAIIFIGAKDVERKDGFCYDIKEGGTGGG